jgi:Flp pilus assembly protein TadG
MKSLRRSIQAFFRDRAGVATLEFTIFAPILLLMALGTYDVSRAMHDTMRLETAARVGVEYALRAPSDSAGIQNAALNTLQAVNGAVVNPAVMTCSCPGVAEGPCGAPCTGMKRYISLVVQENFTGVLIKSITVLHGNATARLR